MKKSLIICFVFFGSGTMPMGPGCIRSNSDGIIRDLLFMHIERGHLHVVLDLLDFQTMDLKNLRY